MLDTTADSGVVRDDRFATVSQTWGDTETGLYWVSWFLERTLIKRCSCETDVDVEEDSEGSGGDDGACDGGVNRSHVRNNLQV